MAGLQDTLSPAWVRRIKMHTAGWVDNCVHLLLTFRSSFELAGSSLALLDDLDYSQHSYDVVQDYTDFRALLGAEQL